MGRVIGRVRRARAAHAIGQVLQQECLPTPECATYQRLMWLAIERYEVLTPPRGMPLGRYRRHLGGAALDRAVALYARLPLWRVARTLGVTRKWLRRELLDAGIRLRTPGEAVRLMIRDRPDWHRHFQRKAG